MRDKVVYRPTRFLHLAVADAANAQGSRLTEIIHNMRRILQEIGASADYPSFTVLTRFLGIRALYLVIFAR